jgi:hydroxylamine reductase
VIACALECAALPEQRVRESVLGFHHSAVLGLAGEIVAAVKAGKLRHFFLIGGCDGAEVGRNYYSEFARNTPADTVVLTLGCGKYRIREHDYGTIQLNGGPAIPRLLDMGQCNDAYSAIRVAAALADAFKCSVSELPLTIVLSWFEQKAVAVLLTLLALDVKGIRIGPAAPAFVSPNVMKVLQEKYDLKLTSNSAPLDDLRAALPTLA